MGIFSAKCPSEVDVTSDDALENALAILTFGVVFRDAKGR